MMMAYPETDQQEAAAASPPDGLQEAVFFPQAAEYHSGTQHGGTDTLQIS